MSSIDAETGSYNNNNNDHRIDHNDQVMKVLDASTGGATPAIHGESDFTRNK